MDFRWREFYASFGFERAILERLGKATVQSEVWKEYDLGNLGEEEILSRFIREDPGLEDEIRKVLADTHGIVTVREGARAWIRALKAQGYRVLVLSNFSEKIRREAGEEMGFLEETDGGILSYEDHVIKPMPEIYALLLARYGLQGEECVFLDDLEENLEGARAFGMHTILVKREAEARQALACLLEEMGEAAGKSAHRG